MFDGENNPVNFRVRVSDSFANKRGDLMEQQNNPFFPFSGEKKREIFQKQNTTPEKKLN